MRDREFENIRLVSEDVAEMPYRPTACKNTYRLIVVRKNLTWKKERCGCSTTTVLLLSDERLGSSSAAEIVFDANQRCNQENLHAQLKGGVRALQAPVDNAGKQLGVHGDDVAGVELEGVVRAVADGDVRAARTSVIGKRSRRCWGWSSKRS